MSVIHASLIGRPGWSVVFALVTLFIVGSAGATFVDLQAHPDGFFPSPFEAGAVPITFTFAEVLPPCVALLAGWLLRPRSQMRRASGSFASDMVIR
jgi:hypothetical protein